MKGGEHGLGAKSTMVVLSEAEQRAACRQLRASDMLIRNYTLAVPSRDRRIC